MKPFEKRGGQVVVSWQADFTEDRFVSLEVITQRAVKKLGSHWGHQNTIDDLGIGVAGQKLGKVEDQLTRGM